jgi:hypothetical protein
VEEADSFATGLPNGPGPKLFRFQNELRCRVFGLPASDHPRLYGTVRTSTPKNIVLDVSLITNNHRTPYLYL